MTPAGLWLAFWISTAPAAAPSACQPLEGDQILAKDLASSWPAFAAIPPDTQIAYAPAPGALRVFRAAELARLSRRFAVPLEGANDVCFERPMRVLTRENLQEAMRASLAAEARVEIVEFSRYPVPRGEIEFPRDALGTPAGGKENGPALWKGYVRYADHHRFAVWARVQVAVPLKRVVAAEALHAGQPIGEKQLRLETYEGHPAQRQQALAFDQVAGHLPRRPIPAGSIIFLNQLEGPRDVSRGETVEIEVRSGAARLAFEGRAESAGRRGDTIAVRNPQSGKNFSARVEGKGKVAVNAASMGKP